MKQRFDFEEIRPLYDEEVPEVMPALLEEPAVKHFVQYVVPNLNFEDFKAQMLQMKNKRDFQTKVIAPFLFKLAEKTATSLDLSGTNLLAKDDTYTFISNHRDIVLDAAFLNILLHRDGFDTVEVAIGDNLLVYPWIRTLVRMNKSFIVKRDVPVRQLLEVSRRLSSYIRFALNVKRESVWIAQREGRSKDSTDRTQEGLVKMLSLGGGKEFLKSIRDIRIAPVAISYEYDPCDYLKAQEFQLKRDNPEFKKQKKDDLMSMQTGMTGFKGNIHFQIAGELNDQLDTISPELDKAAQVAAVAALIDRMIHANLRMYANNYIAYDLLNETSLYSAHYTAEEVECFKGYIAKQLAKIQVPNKDEAFLQHKLLEMYANPLINYLKAVDA